MTIKLLLLKSGEDIIADVSEMVVGEEEDKRVIGYFLNKACVVKMMNPNLINKEEEGTAKRTGFEVSLFPWMPLSKERTISIPTDWVITMVEPIDNLKEMYIEDIVNYGKRKDDQSDSVDDQASSD